jgi:hypothetical protein
VWPSAGGCGRRCACSAPCRSTPPSLSPPAR